MKVHRHEIGIRCRTARVDSCGNRALVHDLGAVELAEGTAAPGRAQLPHQELTQCVKREFVSNPSSYEPGREVFQIFETGVPDNWTVAHRDHLFIAKSGRLAVRNVAAHSSLPPCFRCTWNRVHFGPSRGIMSYSALLNSAILHTQAPFTSETPSASTDQTAASSGASQQTSSSLRVIGDDYYTPSRSGRHDNSLSSTSATGAQNQATAQNSTDTQMSALLSAITSMLSGSGLSGSGSATNSPVQSGSGSQANSPLASALQTAEQDGAQVAQWMSEQAQMGSAAQATSPAAANLMSSGAALVSQFSDDLNQVGDAISQTVSSVANDLEAQGFSSSQVGFVSDVLTSALDSAALGTIGSSINAEAGSSNGAGEGSTFGFSDSALSQGKGSTAGPSQLSMYIAGSNAPDSTGGGGAGAYGFALQFDSMDSTAVVDGESVTANSDGSTTATEAASASNVDQYTMYTAGDLQSGSGQNSLTTAVMNGAISNTVGLGVSETTAASATANGSATSQSAVAINAYSETMNLSMANTSANSSIPSNANGSTNAAPAYSYFA
jgi:hypothetical protein